MDGDTQRLKKLFLSALPAGHPARMGEGGGEEMIAQSFSSGPRPIAQEGPAKVYSRFFSPIPVFSKERNAKIE